MPSGKTEIHHFRSIKEYGPWKHINTSKAGTKGLSARLFHKMMPQAEPARRMAPEIIPAPNPFIFHKASGVMHILNSRREGPMPANPDNSYMEAHALTIQEEEMETARAPKKRV